jgi:hypothetical protein
MLETESKVLEIESKVLETESNVLETESKVLTKAESPPLPPADRTPRPPEFEPSSGQAEATVLISLFTSNSLVFGTTTLE